MCHHHHWQPRQGLLRRGSLARKVVRWRCATCKKPITEHVKNVLRGRAAWGLVHPLQAVWAQLPSSELVLSDAAALPQCAAKRARKAAPVKAVTMAAL